MLQTLSQVTLPWSSLEFHQFSTNNPDFPCRCSLKKPSTWQHRGKLFNKKKIKIWLHRMISSRRYEWIVKFDWWNIFVCRLKYHSHLSLEVVSLIFDLVLHCWPKSRSFRLLSSGWDLFVSRHSCLHAPFFSTVQHLIADPLILKWASWNWLSFVVGPNWRWSLIRRRFNVFGIT